MSVNIWSGNLPQRRFKNPQIGDEIAMSAIEPDPFVLNDGLARGFNGESSTPTLRSTLGRPLATREARSAVRLHCEVRKGKWKYGLRRYLHILLVRLERPV